MPPLTATVSNTKGPLMPALKTILTGTALLCSIAAQPFSLAVSAYAQEAITTPILTSDPNFRDLAGIAAQYGGTGYANTTSNGGVMRTGVLYRSMALSTLSNGDWTTLSSMHIVLDIDLRTPAEIYNIPPVPASPMNGTDNVPAGAAWINVNIFGTTQPPALSGASLYQSFVTSESEAAAFGTALKHLAAASGPAMYHCSYGKDRTGWTSMLLQSIAGVPLETIKNDYMASNDYLNYSGAVQLAWLQAGLDQVSTQYGSMHAYLTQGLGLTQADIYVLRGRMVYYSVLPGENGLSGNAAAGAAFLNALQNSPLSGHYTAYNYFLQAAIDAGTLGGVETRAGGQIHADAASYLMRQPLWIDDAISPYTNGRDLRKGQGRVWLAGIGSSSSSEGGAGVADTSERSTGSVIGATSRFDNWATANVGVGYNSGLLGSADASGGVDTTVFTIGGRYGFASLDTGPYVVTRADVGWVQYKSSRVLGSGLGIARGDTEGGIYSGLLGVGDVIRIAPLTITAQARLRVTETTLGDFAETGSELALNVNEIDKTSSGVAINLDVSLDHLRLDAWTIVPTLTLAYERALGTPQAVSTGTLYGASVNQYSAYDSRDLMKAGVGITAQRDGFTVDANANAITGNEAKSTGISGQLSIRYSF